MCRMRSFSIILLFLFIPVSVIGAGNEGEAGSLTLSVDKQEAMFGSIIELNLNYTLPAGASMGEKPQIKGIENLYVVDKNIMPGHIVIRVLLDTPQMLETKSIKLAYLDSKGRKNFLTAPGISVKVLSNIPGNEKQPDIKPIIDIMPAKRIWTWWLGWAMALIILALALVAVIMGIKKWKSKGQYTRVADPPHILARKQLDDLLREHLFEKGLYKDFYFRLSEIIRKYIESVRGFPAGEYTTEEIARHLVKDPDKEILTLLRHADLVKFADAVVSPHKNQEEIRAVFEYITRTSPSEQAEEKPLRGTAS